MRDFVWIRYATYVSRAQAGGEVVLRAMGKRRGPHTHRAPVSLRPSGPWPGPAEAHGPSSKSRKRGGRKHILFDDVTLLFRCFLSVLPIYRINPVWVVEDGVGRFHIPRSAELDGGKLVRLHGSRFVKYIVENLKEDPLEATLVDFAEALWEIFWWKFATSSSRRTLTYEYPDVYRTCDLEWPGFWITTEELEMAIRDGVLMYSLARHAQFADVC